MTRPWNLNLLKSRTRSKRAVVIAVLAFCSAAIPAFFAAAQAPTQQVNPTTVAPPQPAVQQEAQRLAAIILVKNALLAVNQGNLTGNYTVLRDLSTPGFREKNSAADLATIFQGIRQQKFDLSSIAVLDPVLSQPRISPNGQLALDGYFTAQRMRINFQLAFQQSNSGTWLIHGVSLNAVPDPATVSQLEQR